MTIRTANAYPLFYARLAGFLYLLVIPLGIFGALYVSSRLIVPGDAARTADNIMNSEALFRLGIVSDLLASLVMLLMVLVLYPLLKPVNKNVALLMVSCVLVGASIAMLNSLVDICLARFHRIDRNQGHSQIAHFFQQSIQSRLIHHRTG